MHVYLIRHAHADEGKDDAARPLSKKGHKQIRRIGRFLRKAKAVDAAEFWHSRLARSKDTAELLKKRLRSKARLVEVSGIENDDDPTIIARKLVKARHPVAIVGHDPHLSALASLLVSGRAQPPCISLEKCAVLRLDHQGTRWSVHWQLSPELLDDDE
jgi:phosphohistidine phosphatase